MERQFSEQEQVRRDKLEEIRNYCNPYPERYEVTHKIKDARLLEDGTTDVAIAGRIVFMRKMGESDVPYLTVEILYPKTENVNVQMKLKPLWFGLFLILINMLSLRN